jgi:hypothetical protein
MATLSKVCDKNYMDPNVLPGSEMESKWMTWRIVYLVTLVQVVLLNAYYGACMVSDLLQPPPRTIHNVRDLINSRLLVGYVDNRHNREYFQVENIGNQGYNSNCFKYLITTTN